MTALEEMREHIRAAFNELNDADALCTAEFCDRHVSLSICICEALANLRDLMEGAEEESE